MSGRSEHRRPSVRFSESSPDGGSHHHRSDSGVGSLSDYDPELDRTDRRRSSTNSVAALQLALDREREDRLATLGDLAAALKDLDKWKKKAIDADNLRVDIQRQLNDAKGSAASSQGLASRVELLEQENRDVRKENKKLAEANAVLSADLSKARKKLKKYESDDSPSPPPAMRGGAGEEKPMRGGGNEKLKRRMSTSHASKSQKGLELEMEKETERLRSRFDRSDQSDTSNSTGKSSSTRRRRDSTYVEPLGQGAPRPQVPMPPSPTRHYSTFATTQQHAPLVTSLQSPVVGQVPRSVHPSVTYTYDDHQAYKERGQEDGNYNIHPLPREHRR